MAKKLSRFKKEVAKGVAREIHLVEETRLKNSKTSEERSSAEERLLGIEVLCEMAGLKELVEEFKNGAYIKF